MGKLNAGAQTLAQGTPKLATGLQTAHSGSETLASGLRTYDEKAIEKLVGQIGGKLDEDSLHLRAMAQRAKAYDTFTGKTAGTKGSVKFVIQTEEVE